MSDAPVAVIMAGGSGERFWPLSRCQRPKQLLRLTSPDRTLLEESVDRVVDVIPRKRVMIATAAPLVEPICAAMPDVPSENIVGEPAKRNTAGALVWAAAQLIARFGSTRIPMAVLTADHAIGAPERFHAAVRTALQAAEEGSLVTIGVVPTRPETGYGYIEIAEDAKPLMEPGEDLPQVYAVESFREKPDQSEAERYIETGRFLWNSGMFFWRIDRFLAELRETSPPHAEATERIAEALGRNDDAAARAAFEALPNISIDYALMEKAKRVAVVRADFPWDDVGAWDALGRGRDEDADGNITEGDPVLIDTRNTIVYNEPGAARMAVATVGVEDLIVVVTGDAVLVVPRDRAQDVKKAVQALRDRDATQL